jgi:hypothetical protein
VIISAFNETHEKVKKKIKTTRNIGKIKMLSSLTPFSPTHKLTKEEESTLLLINRKM